GVGHFPRRKRDSPLYAQSTCSELRRRPTRLLQLSVGGRRNQLQTERTPLRLMHTTAELGEPHVLTARIRNPRDEAVDPVHHCPNDEQESDDQSDDDRT